MDQIVIKKSTVKFLIAVLAVILVISLSIYLSYLSVTHYQENALTKMCKTGKVVNFKEGADLYTLKEMQDNPKLLKCIEMQPDEAIGMAFLNIKDPNSDEGKLAFFTVLQQAEDLKNSDSLLMGEGYLNPIESDTNVVQEESDKIIYDTTDYSEPMKSQYKIPLAEGGFIEATNCDSPSTQFTTYQNGLELESSVESCDDGTFVFTGVDKDGVVHLKLVTVNGDTYYTNNENI